MTTVAESSIFASPESTPDTGMWPTREDVFAETVGDTEYAAETGWGHEEADTPWHESGDSSASYVSAAEYDEASDYEDDNEDVEFTETGYHEADYETDSEDADAYEDPQLTTVTPGRLIVQRHPLLRSHAGTPPDVLVEWNGMVQPSVVDVVVHLHGYSGHGAAMNIVKHKKPISGLDFTDPANKAAVGRTNPTLLVLPRGHHQPKGRYVNQQRYTFPALLKPGALQSLIDDALARFATATGARVRRHRLILTAHSGGGAALMAILAHTDPDEVHTFDALYNDPTPLIAWARQRMAAGTGALRVLYRPGEGTARHSERVGAAVRAAGSPNFRVERTSVAHNAIPRTFGWQLLADPSADMRGITRGKEAEDESFATQEGDGEYWGETSEEEAEYVAESDAHECACKGHRAAEEEAPTKRTRRTLGKCAPAQDDRTPTKSWAEQQKKFAKQCSVNSRKFDAKSLADCACAVGEPRQVAMVAMARVRAAGPLAARLFQHFLDATGTEVNIDVLDMIRRSSGVRAKIRKSIARGGMAGVTRIEQSEYGDTDLQFAYGAIDCVQWRVLPPAGANWRKNPATKIEISMLDYYEFHPERTAASQCAHTACVELVARRQAKNFWTSGRAAVSWADLGGKPAPAPARPPKQRRDVVYQNTY
ncbi:hypothetical protein ACFWPX_02900 [Nocardia sp. NPDC058518]|uniref:hypothetical protein n=1 Tax=Nocardia sp. NPDC058518 TaxID=3346534 RepID=UPI0036630E2B